MIDPCLDRRGSVDEHCSVELGGWVHIQRLPLPSSRSLFRYHHVIYYCNLFRTCFCPVMSQCPIYIYGIKLINWRLSLFTT
jgi:hypothetical protein